MLPLLLFGSGFCALVYQTLWLRLLGLVFGVTVYAASTVLAAFMAGLAVGSYLSGRIADRVRSPLSWFGIAEIAIGLSALATPLLLDALTLIYRDIYGTVSTDLGVLTAARFTASFLTLLVPTSLMGATMPLAVKAVVTRPEDVGRRVAFLYAANTAGALAGALLTGYILISGIGITSSFRLAALCNVIVGAAALLIARRRPAAPPLPTVAAKEFIPPEASAAQSPGIGRLILAVFAASGFVSLALEIAWFRALVLFMQATTYAFTTILALVLAGIAGGSALARIALRRQRNWLAWLAVIEIALAVAAVGSVVVLAAAFDALWTRGTAVEVAALAVLPATMLMGLAFPIGLHCWGSAGRDTGARVGRFYMFNLAGSILGALAAGFVSIAAIGTRGTLIAAASISLISGLALLGAQYRRHPRFAALVGPVGVALFAAVAAAAPHPVQAVLATRFPGETILWQTEDPQATVTVQDQRGRRVMYLDGNHQASDGPDMLSLHRLIGMLGPALHPSPRDVLVIGLGGGVTAGAAARFSGAQVEIVELSPGVVEAADWFTGASGSVLEQPNVTLRIDDGRNYLLMTSKQYDVITADIIQPFHAGAGNLYSREYFELAAARLRDAGVMVQWIGRRPETQYRLMARTFQSVFPETTVWADGTVLVGRKTPLTLSLSQYRTRLTSDLRGPLAFAGIFGFGGLMSRYVAGPEELRRFVGDGPLLTDDRPRMEFFRSLPGNEPDAAIETMRGAVDRHFVD